MTKKQIFYTTLICLAVEVAIHWPLYAIPLIIWFYFVSLVSEYIEKNDEKKMDFFERTFVSIIWPFGIFVDENLRSFIKEKLNIPSFEFHNPVTIKQTFADPDGATQDK